MESQLAEEAAAYVNDEGFMHVPIPELTFPLPCNLKS